ncbi:MAG: bifunctional precorrin-2 dehydrogenase/sirohydrochlorin ferrochelatase [Chloroflexi bacterium]|nr:bifunctional precorrin-2 dehydrogenase/sirohydrochlorin ferrochelatase [Chloroflexota bacterium]
MPQYYPAFLDLQGKPVVIIGGGEVCEGKIPNLLECGATITLVAPAVTERIREWAHTGQITWIPREYQAGDLANAWIAVVGTDDPAVNQRAADEARARRILVNTVDDVKNCDFIAPAVVRRGELVLAISTGGGSPAMARYLREELQRTFPPEYAQLLQVLSDARTEVRRRGLRPSPERWQECIDDELKALVRAGALEEATARLVRMLSEHPHPVGATQEG